MTPSLKLALTCLGALALGALGTWLLTREAGTVPTPLRDLDGASQGGGDGTPGMGPGGATDPTPTARNPVIGGGAPRTPGDLIGVRTPSGIDLSDPAQRAKALRELLSAIEIDWAAVAELLAVLPPGERLDADLADVLLNGLRSDRRNMALLAFARLNDGSLVQDLFDLFADGTASPGARAAALRALWEMPGADVAEVVRGLESQLRGSPEEDRELLYGIARRGGAEAARALLQYMERVPEVGRIPDHVLQQLDLGTSSEALELMRAALTDPKSPEIAEKLLSIVAFQHAQGLTAQVIAMDRDGMSDALRNKALDALRQIGDQQAVDHLLGLARQPGAFGDVALRAVADLGRADEGARAALLKALEQAALAPRPNALREALLLSLGAVEHSPAVPIVAGFLKDPNSEVQTAAVRSLGRMGSRAREQVTGLVALWTGGDESLRRDLAIALSSIGGADAAKALGEWIKDPELSPSLERTLHVGLRNALESGAPR